jgi:hypothetical protein
MDQMRFVPELTEHFSPKEKIVFQADLLNPAPNGHDSNRAGCDEKRRASDLK